MQLRAWANMIQLNAWKSLDEPPDKPFFRANRKRASHSSEEREDLSCKATKQTSSFSPEQKVKVRSELIDQLDKFHKLKASGVLSSAEYELRSTILLDIKNL